MTNTFARPTLGILSGHSALAGSCYHARLLNRLRLAGATHDEQYPRIAHWSTPLMGLDDAGLASGAGGRSLALELQHLDAFVPRHVAVTCNSLAQLVDSQRDAGPAARVARTPVHAVNEQHIAGRVLILAAGNARRFEMVQPHCDQHDYATGGSQAWVLGITQAVREQGITLALQQELEQFLAAATLEQGYDKVVLACTELSALVTDSPIAGASAQHSYVDAMACLLDEALGALRAS